MVLCKCGCGQEIINLKYNWNLKKYQEYLHGHNCRGIKYPPEYGEKISERLKNEFPPIFDICWYGCGRIVWGGKIFIHGHNGKFVKHDNNGEKNPLFGKQHSQKSIQQSKEKHLGQIPWNKGKIGIYSEDVLKLMSDNNKGRIPWNKGIPVSEETRSKVSENNKGRIPWNKGLLGYHGGENHWNWQNGKSFEPYCPKFTKELKEEIRNKYDRKCCICGKNEKYNITKKGKMIKLCVHHVDMDKGQGCSGKRWKLIPLCINCHIKLHNGVI